MLLCFLNMVSKIGGPRISNESGLIKFSFLDLHGIMQIKHGDTRYECGYATSMQICNSKNEGGFNVSNFLLDVQRSRAQGSNIEINNQFYFLCMDARQDTSIKGGIGGVLLTPNKKIQFVFVTLCFFYQRNVERRRQLMMVNLWLA